MEPKNNHFEKIIHHLENRSLPIRVCISDATNLTEEVKTKIKKMTGEGFYVPYAYGVEYLREHNIKGSPYNYVISPCDSRDKFSQEYFFCTGVIVVGVDKETKENIAFLSHQNPDSIKSSEFRNDFEISLQDIKDHSIPGSIDAVIYGGMAVNNEDIPLHKKIVENISLIIENKLNLEPTIITGPDSSGHSTNVYFNPKNRQLDLIRGEQKNSTRNEAFTSSDYSAQEEKW